MNTDLEITIDLLDEPIEAEYVAVKGPKGDPGETGPQGEQGIQGPKGDKGDQGDPGPKGDKGDQGEKGETGEAGAKGDKGDKGDTGDTGPQGIQGEQGPAGQNGTTPVKGTDYWTAEDKAEIVEDVVEEIDIPVEDVQIDGTSILNNGVANIPVASSNTFGVIKAGARLAVENDSLLVRLGTESNIKSGTSNSMVLTPGGAYATAFYGLAKAAGDTTQSASSNPVGTYTDSAKSAIKAMLGVSEAVTENVSGSDPTITAQANHRYVCGTVASLNFTPCASGICDVIFTSGSTPAVLTLPNTVKLPAWFSSGTLDADTTYEINIMDGIYGAVMAWT